MAMRARCAAMVSAWVAVCSAGLALAQGQPAGSPPDGVLGGPKVKDNSVPGAKSRFSTGKGDKKDRALDRGIPPGVYMRALESLRSEQASEGVRLTKEQDEKIHAITREFMESERAYIQQHRDELASLRNDLPPDMRKRVDERLKSLKAFERGAPKEGEKKVKKGQPVPPPSEAAPDEPMMDKGAPADPKKAEAARDRLEQIFENAPKPKDAQSKVWALLTDAQRPVLQAEIERLKKEGPGAGRPGGAEAGAPGDMREKLKNMSPEERQKFIAEMRQRRGAGRAAEGQPKPAPGPGDVNVPPPQGEPK